MTDKKTDNKSKNVNDDKTELTNVLKSLPEILTTNDISTILTARYKRTVTDRWIRTQFRKHLLFDGFKTANYTKYNFRNNSETVLKIIERFDEIEQLNIAKFEKSKLKKSERQLKKQTVIEIDSDNNIKSEIVKPTETVTK